ncbi:MAG: bifunctional DNA-formamidopyrimidine glycosylase/DNA-(apurinic or apyrimidinic site) lyase [Candidatus Paceibacterota bacterium]
MKYAVGVGISRGGDFQNSLCSLRKSAMPELPEVETTARMLNERVKGLVISDIWTDYDSKFHRGKDNIKDKKYFAYFKKELVGRKILGVRRRAKNVLIDVSGNKTILTHMKMTGHFLYGKYEYKDKKWSPVGDSPLKDPFNRFVHLVFILSNNHHLVLSDMRKFAKVFVFDTDRANRVGDISRLGPEPLDKDFSYKIFKEKLLARSTGKIKSVLMDQEVIAGIGNIYSDEALWTSGIHPETKVKNIAEEKLKSLFKNVIKILRQSIGVGGDSMSDYRNPDGVKGRYQDSHKVYRRAGERCSLKGCKGIIKRIRVGGRSAHFCDCHQDK